jgi:uncharacterized membrane protein
MSRDEKTAGGRIELIDGLRGFCIILVIAYHLGYNLVEREYLPIGAIDNLPLNILQPFFAGVFILLAGVSSRLSRNNLKRGLLLAGCALLVTGVSIAFDSPIYFGILHLLASCILLYALIDKLRVPTAPVMLLGAFFAVYFKVTRWPVVSSADYFPLLPWGFLFFFGVLLGRPIYEGAFPEWFYRVKIPLLPAVGRKTLLIYLGHQPMLYGVLWIVERNIG